ncbi:MAG TPA: hypothetical protein VE398_14815, partial [Acidobacteriota bacterium]|nr:hypothetical protein [Acidobacteriota bacterium]
MRHVLCALAITLAGSSLVAQNQQTPPPQSARQALIEMFLGKGEDDLAKHLPDITRKAMIRKDESPESSIVLRIAGAGRSMAAQGRTVETFDTGPNILVTEDSEHERVEVAVEHDSLMGDQDEIELSVHGYKDGQEENLPVIPRLIFTMKQEKDVWQLTEITVAGHIPLTDPDYLKGLRKQQDEANEQMAQMRMNMIVNGQKAYSAAHPEIGYACALTSLVPQKTDSAGAEASTSFDPGQGSEEWNGYRFTLNGCGGTPSSKYRVAAVPIDSASTGKTFCADESGKIKFVNRGKPSSCFSSGQELNPPAA